MPYVNFIIRLVLLAVPAAWAANSYSTSTFQPTSCPPALPTGALRYKTNSTQSKSLGGSIGLYNGTSQRLHTLQLNVTKHPATSFGFTSKTTITVADGSAIEYVPGSSSITIIGPNCQSGVVVTNMSTGSTIARREHRTPAKAFGLEPRAEQNIGVTLALSNACGQPVTHVVPILECTPVLYVAEQYGQPPVYGQVVDSNMANEGGGVYVGQCAIDQKLQLSNRRFQACVAQDRENVDKLCGPDMDAVNQVHDFLDDIKDLVKAAEIILQKTKAALTFYGRACQFLENPDVVSQYDLQDCGQPDGIAFRIYDSPISEEFNFGTVTATPTSTMVTATGYFCSQSSSSGA